MSDSKVLIVEDVKVAQWMVVLILEQLHCDVDTADDGASAINLVKQHDYDLIFMDLGLPDMDGIEVTEAIRALEAADQKPPMPVVALTAHTAETYRDRCAAVGINDFLEKPLTLDTAKAVLDKLLQKR
ncbi:MAG: response regulator [Gammaproteobacteria bacterium]|nr:response regulator [Gammaproteobacteria bacterium]